MKRLSKADKREAVQKAMEDVENAIGKHGLQVVRYIVNQKAGQMVILRRIAQVKRVAKRRIEELQRKLK